MGLICLANLGLDKDPNLKYGFDHIECVLLDKTLIVLLRLNITFSDDSLKTLVKKSDIFFYDSSTFFLVNRVYLN